MNFHSKGKFKQNNSCKTADEVTTLGQCTGEDNPRDALTSFAAKVPVIVAEQFIQVDLESVERLPKPAREIKRIRKNVHLTQCKLIQSYFDPSSATSTGLEPDFTIFAEGAAKLFLAGFVRKNIEYVPSCSGGVEHHTVDVPFHCVVPIDNLTNFQIPLASFKNGVVELIFNDKHGMGMDPKMQGFVTHERFNEKPFCELEFAGITEIDIAEDWKPHCNVFRTVREKMIVNLQVTVLQLRHVQMDGLTP